MPSTPCWDRCVRRLDGRRRTVDRAGRRARRRHAVHPDRAAREPRTPSSYCGGQMTDWQLGSLQAVPHTTVSPSVVPQTTVSPSAVPQTTVSPSAVPQTTVSPSLVPQTTVPPPEVPHSCPDQYEPGVQVGSAQFTFHGLHVAVSAPQFIEQMVPQTTGSPDAAVAAPQSLVHAVASGVSRPPTTRPAHSS